MGSTAILMAQPDQRIDKLLKAAQTGDIAMVAKLVQEGAKVNSHNANGETPLHHAALTGHERVVQFLLTNGSHINARTNEGATPLFLAAQEGHTDVVKLLLERGAKRQLDFVAYKLTPLQTAIENNHQETVELLLKSSTKDEIESRTAKGQTGLMLAAIQGNVAICEKLVDAGAEINASEDGITPVFFAAFKGHAKVIEVLSKRGALVNVPVEKGQIIPLMAASREGHLEAVLALIKAGANISYTNDLKWNAYYLADMHKHKKVCEALETAYFARNRALGNLGALRSAVAIYFSDAYDDPSLAKSPEGYPKTLERAYSHPSSKEPFPEIQLVNHQKTRTVTIYPNIGTKDTSLSKFDISKSNLLKDTGGWGYDPHRGLAFIDCTHMDWTGEAWYEK
ncbi:MAG: ankyrin repeat domain-containing protein [Elusimicrobia bacterium]|nr:ankyrin repeat domain-containing protein [Elusimicrobiota bacterium]